MSLDEYIRLHYMPIEQEVSQSRRLCYSDEESLHSESIREAKLTEVRGAPCCIRINLPCIREEQYLESSVRSGIKQISTAEFLASLPDFEVESNFGDVLHEWLVKKELTAPQVYKACNMTRANFNQHLNSKRHPSKETILAMCIGLQLTLREARKFVKQAGYGLSRHIMQDIIVTYFLSKRFYDIDVVNDVLFARGLPVLTGKKVKC